MNDELTAGKRASTRSVFCSPFIVHHSSFIILPMPYSPPPRLSEKGGWTVSDPARVRLRATLCVLALCIAFGGLLARLWYLQVVQGSYYLAQAQRNRTENVPLPAPRGLITDRHGTVLATSRAAHSVAVVPAALPSAKRDPASRAAILKTLSFLVGTTPVEIERRIKEASTRGGRLYDPVRIGNEVDLATITRVEENKVRLGQAVLITDDIARVYPSGALAAHILGYSGGVTREEMKRENAALAAQEARENGDAVGDETASDESGGAALEDVIAPPRDLAYDDIVGKIGLEKEYDRVLAGARGSEEFEVDARGRPVRKRGHVNEIPGQTLTLNIDANLQRAAEKALDAARNSGAAAVIDPRNGEVLALASRPTFDPNIFSLKKQFFQPKWIAINANPKHPLINRAVTSRFPPGSTFKPFVAAAGLQQGSITLGTHYFCNGGLRVGRFFGCWGVHHDEDVIGAIADSCDVFFYQSALHMGNPESSGPTYLAKTVRRFGFGSVTGIDLPVEAKGLIPDPAWRRRVNAKRPAMQRWFPGNTLNMAIGQGDVLVTPLQLALATGAVANGGTLWTPHLMREIRDSKSGRVLAKSEPQGKSVGIEPRYLADAARGMRAVITRGTGKYTFADIKNVALAGKSGSAEDANNTLPHAWFTAFAPYDATGKVKPRLCIAVIVENSGHGADNAAPVVKAILKAAFPEAKPAPTSTASTR